jgi:hypothetical protein
VVLQPQNCLNNSGLGSSHFDRHYSGNHYCFLFLRLMRCFSSPGLLPYCYGYHDYSWWVVPFGNPRIDSYLPIPAAYRSLSRPSSPLRAKASPVRPCLFSFAFISPPSSVTINRNYGGETKKFLSFVICFQYVKDRKKLPQSPRKDHVAFQCCYHGSRTPVVPM